MIPKFLALCPSIPPSKEQKSFVLSDPDRVIARLDQLDLRFGRRVGGLRPLGALFRRELATGLAQREHRKAGSDAERQADEVKKLDQGVEQHGASSPLRCVSHGAKSSQRIAPR